MQMILSVLQWSLRHSLLALIALLTVIALLQGIDPPWWHPEMPNLSREPK
jgi:hypothetical protein